MERPGTKYITFGRTLGLANWRSNGYRLGVMKTFCKIAQPVNSFTRIPEYLNFEIAISQIVAEHPGTRLTILDLGSPKLFGLYIAHFYPVDVILSDLNKKYLEEYEVLWDLIRLRAQGSVTFAVVDARHPPYPAHSFDIVYSMSVIEHIGGVRGDEEAIRQMRLITKPGGLLLISVPYGNHYIEQSILAKLSYGTSPTEVGDGFVFFQRIYDDEALARRILHPLGLTTERILVARKQSMLMLVYRRIPLLLRAGLGFLNPLLSDSLNVYVDTSGPVTSSYGEVHSIRDVYADMILYCRVTDEAERDRHVRSIPT